MFGAGRYPLRYGITSVHSWIFPDMALRFDLAEVAINHCGRGTIYSSCTYCILMVSVPVG